jgi:outer membrane protein assembly factor BamD (BamD/ComL family)
MKRLFIFLFIIAAFVAPARVFAQNEALSDLEAMIIQEDYKKANNAAKSLLKTRLSVSDTAQVEYYLGLSHLRLGEYAQAYDMFKKVTADRPSTELYEKAYIGSIDALYMQGYYENALKEAVSLINRHPRSEMMSLIYLKAARSSLKLARWTKAKEYLQKILKEYPDSFESGVARQLLEEKQYFTVQVGAFTEQGRAEHLVKELIQRKEYAYIVENKAPDGKKFFRVRVGQMTALKDAQALESKLSGLGYPTRIYP